MTSAGDEMFNTPKLIRDSRNVVKAKPARPSGTGLAILVVGGLSAVNIVLVPDRHEHIPHL